MKALATNTEAVGGQADCPAGHEVEGVGYVDDNGDVWCSKACLLDAAETQAANDAERRMQ